MKKGKTKEYLIRLNLNHPDDREVFDRLEHRQGMTVTGFFVNAVLAGSKGILREPDYDSIRQMIREELNRIPIQSSVHHADLSSDESATPGVVTGETLDFMKDLGFD